MLSTVCNALPASVVSALSLTVFKSHLKTYLFQQQSYRHSHWRHTLSFLTVTCYCITCPSSFRLTPRKSWRFYYYYYYSTSVCNTKSASNWVISQLATPWCQCPQLAFRSCTTGRCGVVLCYYQIPSADTAANMARYSNTVVQVHIRSMLRTRYTYIFSTNFALILVQIFTISDYKSWTITLWNYN